MAGRIPQSFLDELLERTDLVELVQQFVPLKRAGAEYKACCPFHDENTPSFYVSPKKQFYHCFGCGAHGTAFDFLMDHQNLSFPEAVAQLAERAGLEVPREDGADTTAAAATALRSPLRDALEAACSFYRTQLRHTPAAIDYLKRRGLSGVVARDYALGWAPESRTALLEALSAEHRIEHLISVGLVTEDGQRDRFFGRVMFPIRDRRGRVVGFGGRRIDNAEPKYLNSPEGPLFHKGEIVYGLFEARRDERALDELVVVEGYMDVIALAQHGFHRAVACMGTALTEHQLETLFRQVDRVVFCFDGDAAGKRAARRSIDTALPLMGGTRSLRVLLLDGGDDPDSLVRREGLSAWNARLAEARPLADVLLDLLGEDHDPTTADGRSRLAHAALDACAHVADDVYRAQLAALIAERTQTPLTTLTPVLERLRRDHETQRLRQPRAAADIATRSSRGRHAPHAGTHRRTEDEALTRLDRLLAARAADAAATGDAAFGRAPASTHPLPPSRAADASGRPCGVDTAHDAHAAAHTQPPHRTERHKTWKTLFHYLAQSPETLRVLVEQPAAPASAATATPPPSSAAPRSGAPIDPTPSAEPLRLGDALCQFDAVDPGACALLAQLLALASDDLTPRTPAQLIEALRGTPAHGALADALIAQAPGLVRFDNADATTRARMVLDVARRLLRQLRLGRMHQLTHQNRPLTTEERAELTQLVLDIAQQDTASSGDRVGAQTRGLARPRTQRDRT